MGLSGDPDTGSLRLVSIMTLGDCAYLHRVHYLYLDAKFGRPTGSGMTLTCGRGNNSLLCSRPRYLLQFHLCPRPHGLVVLRTSVFSGG